MIEFILIVESSADARTATKLAERVLVEKIDWLDTDLLKHLCKWSGLEEGTEYSCWKDINDLVKQAKQSGLRLPKFIGHRKNRPLKADGAAAIKILNLVQLLQKTRDIKALIFIRDLDNQPERREGIEQARSEFTLRQPLLEIVIGTAERMRESWVLNGFIPSNQQETQILEEIKAKLNFDPCEESHRLRSNSKEEPLRMRNPKVLVEQLTGGKMERERLCWEQTSLEILRKRGVHTGLTNYLIEVEQRLIKFLLE